MVKKKKIILPPQLPPEIPDDEIEFSDEDLQFVEENRDYAGFVSRLDTESITRHVSRVADVKEDDLEALYEKRRRLQKREEEENEKKQEVIHVDSLPVRALDGTLYYRTFSEASNKAEDGGDVDGDADADKGIVKLTKAERRAKLKKSKKEAKKQGKELHGTEEVKQTPQAAVLAEVKEELTSEEAFESKKHKLAELGMALLSDPDSNIKSLKEMIEFCKDDDDTIVKLGLLSVLAVFKDIIPGYRIRIPTEKEMEMKVSKEVKKMRYYESTLLSGYKAYLQKLIALEKNSRFQRVAIRCICTLLETVPHFNFRESLLGTVVQNMGSLDDVVRKGCCASIKSLFVNEGKHGGELTVEAVRMIADLVKAHSCQLHPDSVEVLMSLSIDEDLLKAEQLNEDSKSKNKNNRKRKFVEEPSQMEENDKRKKKREMMTKMRKEVIDDYKSVAFTPDVTELRRRQSETLSAVFGTYFRILKHTVHSITRSPEADDIESTGDHPLLAPCLNGLGKFSHLLDLDYVGHLIDNLKHLAAGGNSPDSSNKSVKRLTVSERIQCSIIAFKVMRNNLDALNVDLQFFFVQLYNLILEYRPGRDQGKVLAEAFKIMLCDDRQHDMQKAAAFIKRLATFSLCYQSAECMSALVTMRHLLQRNVKCRSLLENDAGGGSVSGLIARYQPYATDPNLSGALASVLWELSLLSKHYHPTVSTMASSILSMVTSHNQVYLSTISPQQAFKDMSLEREEFNPKFEFRKPSKKSKRGTVASRLSSVDEQTLDASSKDVLEKKLSDHFTLLCDLKMNKKLRAELDRTTSALQLYEQYKKQKKKRKHRRIS